MSVRCTELSQCYSRSRLRSVFVLCLHKTTKLPYIPPQRHFGKGKKNQKTKNFENHCILYHDGQVQVNRQVDVIGITLTLNCYCFICEFVFYFKLLKLHFTCFSSLQKKKKKIVNMGICRCRHSQSKVSLGVCALSRYLQQNMCWNEWTALLKLL